MKNRYFISFFLLLAYHMALGQCPSTLQVTSTISSPGIVEKQASTTLNASNTINNGAGAIYRSGSDIILQDGFNAVNGAIFQAYVGNCTNYTCPLPKNLTVIKNADKSVSLNWSLDSPSSVVSWRIQVTPQLASNTAIDVIYNSASPYTYVIPPGELSSGASYTFMVNPVCDANSGSNYVKSIAFTAPQYTELIWNYRTKYRNWQHNNEYAGINPATNSDRQYYSYCPLNNFNDPIIPGRPPAGETLICYTGTNNDTLFTPQISGSLIFDTVNYKNSEYITGNPFNATGFKYDVNYSNGQPIEFNLYNQMYNATQISDTFALREVALMFWHWQGTSTEDMTDNSGRYSFKRSFDLGEFDNNLIVSFKAKINKSTINVNIPKSNSFLTADLRFEYYNGDKSVHYGLVGVIFYENNLENPGDTIYWHDYDDTTKKYRMLIRGSKMGVKTCNYEYQDITINYKDFISLLPPPEGVIYDKVIIKGLDIYTHTNANADLNFSIKDVKILGGSNNPNRMSANTGNENSQNIPQEKAFMRISPNPNSGTFKILFNESGNSKIRVTDLLGNIIYNQNFLNQKEVEVNLFSCSKGIYFVAVQSGDKIYTEKIIIND